MSLSVLSTLFTVQLSIVSVCAYSLVPTVPSVVIWRLVWAVLCVLIVAECPGRMERDGIDTFPFELNELYF